MNQVDAEETAHAFGVPTKKIYGTYNALAVIAFLLPSIEPDTDWAARLAALLRDFSTSSALTVESLGAPLDWDALELWRT